MDSSRQLREAARKHLKVLLAQSAKAQRPTLGVALVVALLAWPALLTFFQGTRVLPTHSFLVRPVPSNGVSQKPHVTVPMHALEQPAPSGQTPSDSEGSSSKTEPEILSQEQILPSSGLSSPLETSSEDPGALILPGAAQASDASTLESLQDKRAGGTTGLHLDLNSEGQASPQASDSGALTPVVSSRGEGGGAVSIRAGGLEPEEPGPRAKLAFLFLTRVVPPLLPLWERFFKGFEGEYSIFIQPVRKLNAETASTMPPAFQQHVLPFFKASWGLMSVVEAERKLLDAALRDPSNTHFILVSESCIPLWSFPYIRDYLTAHPISYIDAAPDVSNKSFGMYMPAAFKGLPPHAMRKGSQWFALRREHADLVAHNKRHFWMHQQNCYMLMRSKFRRCCADEYYAQTLLNQSMSLEHFYVLVTGAEAPGALFMGRGEAKDSAHISHYPITYADWREGTRLFTWVRTKKQLQREAQARRRRASRTGRRRLSAQLGSAPTVNQKQEHQGWSQASRQGMGSSPLHGAATPRRRLRSTGEEALESESDGTPPVDTLVYPVHSSLSGNSTDSSRARRGAGLRKQYKAKVGDKWRGAMHPKWYIAKSISFRVIAKMKRMTNFRQLRPFMGGILVYNKGMAKHLPPEARTPKNGFCSINGKPIHCFLFARKFHPSTLPFLLQHSQKLFGF